VLDADRDYLMRIALEVQQIGEWIDLLLADAEEAPDREAALALADEARERIFGPALDDGLAAADSYRLRVSTRLAGTRAQLAALTEQLRARIADDERRLDTLDEQVEKIMSRAGQRRVSTERVVVSLRKCPPSVEVDERVEQAAGDLLPEEVVRVKFEVDRRRLLEVLQGGAAIPGTRIAPERRTVQWR
jgi:hypothetical protein